LKHEARHFADYKLYPKLQSSTLEYRAKLTELVYANISKLTILDRFTNDGIKSAKSGHSLANWHVINNLVNHFEIKVAQFDQIDWSEYSNSQIQAAATQLLLESDSAINKLGPETTENIIFPITD
jgi:hypothetical protein